MHLGVFVDRLVDDDQQSRARQRQHVLVQVGVAARMSSAARRDSGRAASIDARGRGSIHRMRACVICRMLRTAPDRSRPRREGRGVAVGEAGQPAGRAAALRRCSTGSETAGMPSSDACTVQLGSPVDCKPDGRSRWARRG